MFGRKGRDDALGARAAALGQRQSPELRVVPRRLSADAARTLVEPDVAAAIDPADAAQRPRGDVAREVGGIRLVLGWLPTPLTGLEVDAFAEVVALMPGWGVRDVLRHPNARFAPTRLTWFTALLAGPLRPDLLLTRLGRRGAK